MCDEPAPLSDQKGNGFRYITADFDDTHGMDGSDDHVAKFAV